MLTGTPRRWQWVAAALGLLGIGLIGLGVALGLELLGDTRRHEQQFGDDAAAIDGELVHDLRQLLVLLIVILVGGVAAGALGGWLLVRINRHREHALRELREVNDDLSFYSRIVRATDSALAATDEQGLVIWVNEAFERAQVELALGGTGGRETWLSLDASPLHAPDGSTEGYFAVMTDVTERHELEELHAEARRAAELAAQEKTTFLATMSHEIRTPLNAVLGLTELLLLTDLDDEQRDYVQTAHRSGSHLLALINDVLDFSSLEAGRMEYADETFSMRALLDETVAMFAPTADHGGVALAMRCAPGVPESLRGDTTRLRQVLVNVLGNAMKFTPEGSVEVHCEALDLPDGRCEVVTTVADTGIGIPDDRIPGLAISRRLVEAMGGRTDLVSEVGRGTRVEIRMIHARCTGAPSPAAEQPLPPAAGLAVLVVEDDPVNRKVVTRMLDRLGIVPEVAVNGQEAVEAVRAGTFDVVLMDVQMPVMDGLRAARLIREEDRPDRPWLVALTANALSGDRERFLAEGMDDYLSKPVVLDALAGALARVPNGSGPSVRPGG